jgi:DNA polymerase III delta prime subunit
MHAFLIIGDKTDEEAKKISKILGSKLMEQELHKIADVREFKRLIKLSLMNKTTILSRDINKSTIETQNALLKILEEPQPNLSFILTAPNKQNILPTILSRCKITELKSKKPNKKQVAEAKKFIESSIGEKLTITSKINSRDEAREFLENLILGAHALMIKNPNHASFLEAAQHALNAINKNSNIQLQLTTMVVKSSK